VPRALDNVPGAALASLDPRRAISYPVSHVAGRAGARPVSVPREPADTSARAREKRVEAPGPLQRIERAERVADTAYRRIRTAIVQGQLRPGARVTEAQLSHQLGVSKTPIREALMRLHEVGLVDLQKTRGAVVVSYGDLVDEAQELREVFEGAATALSATRATEADLAELRRIADRATDAADRGDGVEFASWDAMFHLKIAECSRNARLDKLIRDTLDVLSAARGGQPAADGLVACAEGHARIHAALVRRDPEHAAQEMRRHIRRSRLHDGDAPEAV
jgi:DNA-binding GntR family transcriptional regulator